MRVIFNIVALLCLALGLGGIVWCGDWRLLLSFPVAFGLGLGRNAVRYMTREAAGSTWSFLPWEKISFGMHVFLTFDLVYLTGMAMLHFTETPDDAIWTKACWYAGLVLQPWLWRWDTMRAKVDALAAFVLSVVCAVLIAVLPKLTGEWFMVESFGLLAVMLVANKILKRKGVAA